MKKCTFSQSAIERNQPFKMCDVNYAHKKKMHPVCKSLYSPSWNTYLLVVFDKKVES